MSNKKDLTRIEDLSEYIHEITEDEEQNLDPFSSETPDLPHSENSADFEFSEETVFSDDSDEEFKTEDFSSQDTSFEEVASQDEEEVHFTAEDNASFEESLPGPEQELEPTPTHEVRPESFTPVESLSVPENFEDVKKFAESTSFTDMGAEGNPSFSLLIKKVRYIEDVHDILSLLKELKLLNDTEEQVKARLMRGNLLVPRISEYAAIFLAHKLRRFDIDIQVGLSDEIHPPKHQEKAETGLVTKFNLYQNQTHHFHFDDPKLELSQIIVAATPTLDGHQVLRYMGVASEHKMLESEVVEDEDSEDIPRHYQELAQKLKAHALKAHANAVVGLNYQLTPIPTELGISGHKYRLSCTGNLVWVTKL